MKVLIFGATGMVGQGALRECLIDSDVTSVTTIGRKATGLREEKVSEIEHGDMWNYDAIENQLRDFDACFFCLGASAVGMKEKEFYHLTYDLTLAAGKTLAKLNPNMTFVYISGDGTDSTEKGKVMWARVKGKTENDLIKLFKNAYMLRAGLIEPVDGIISKTPLYRLTYILLTPVMPLLHKILPKHITTTKRVGRAMIALAKKGYVKKFLSNADINLLDVKDQVSKI